MYAFLTPPEALVPSPGSGAGPHLDLPGNRTGPDQPSFVLLHRWSLTRRNSEGRSAMLSRISMALGMYWEGRWQGGQTPEGRGSSSDTHGLMKLNSLRKDQESWSPVPSTLTFWPPARTGSSWGDGWEAWAPPLLYPAVLLCYSWEQGLETGLAGQSSGHR